MKLKIEEKYIYLIISLLKREIQRYEDLKAKDFEINQIKNKKDLKATIIMNKTFDEKISFYKNLIDQLEQGGKK